MQQGESEARVVMQQRSRLQPVQQFLGVRRLDDGSQAGVAVAPVGAAAREGEQVQVVVAEHGDGAITERLARSAGCRANAGRD